MKNCGLLLLGLVFLSACNIDKHKEIDVDKLNYHITDDSYLFFRNMRQIYYDIENMDKAGMRLYRWDDRVKEANHPLLNVTIAVNWRYDQAYAIMDENEAFKADTITIYWQDKNLKTSGRYQLSDHNKQDQLLFLTQLYGSLQKDQKLEYASNLHPEKTPFLTTKKEREAIRIPMVDYYRLTHVL